MWLEKLVILQIRLLEESGSLGGSFGINIARDKQREEDHGWAYANVVRAK